MATVVETTLRNQLLGRRRKLEALARNEHAAYLQELLREVDQALYRMDEDRFGICDVCNEPVEEDRLLADPLARVCLDHLPPEELRALERDLELAGRVQSGLLPEPRASFAGWEFHARYQPAGPVSGDYYDLVGAGGEDHLLLFGDIAGKGVAASLLMASLHAMFRSLAGVGLPLAQLLERGNRLFCESTTATSFATLVCARLQPSGVVELANAGHCPPIVRRRGRVESLPATGLPLGLFCSARYDPCGLELDADDLLVLYTDGLSEARNPAGEEYGTERIGVLVGRADGRTAEGLAHDLIEDVGVFQRGVRRTDDLTVLVLRRVD